MMTRRALLAGAAAASAAAIGPQFRLIAHRGGIVDDQHAENTPGSIQAAIDRGYWMIEVDVRMTKDGEPILQHDADFKRFYGEPRQVEEMTWAEIGRLRATPGGNHPIHFRDVCKMCEGRIRLMLDIKSSQFPEQFYTNLRQLLEKHQLLRDAYALSGGGERGARLLTAHCYRSANRTRLDEAIARGEQVSERYFLFELASEIDQETLDLCREVKVTPVAAINTFRYTMANRDEQKGPEEDAARLRKMGVKHYQIDSRYETLFA